MLRRVLLVAAVAGAAVVLTQCAGGNKCPNGCIDGTGTCVSGNVPEACGTNGVSCVACPTGQTCSASKVCVMGGATGGGSAATGGGSAATGGGTAATGGGTANAGGAGATGGGRAGGAGATGGGTATAGGSGGMAGGSGADPDCNLQTNPNCPAGRVCVLISGSSLAGKCRLGCDPFNQDCPVAGQKCTYFNSGAGPTRQCVDAGTFIDGQTCMMETQCGVGLICIGQQGAPAPTCRKFCELGNAASCGAGQICQGLAGQVSGPTPDLWPICVGEVNECSINAQNCANPDSQCFPSGGANGAVCLDGGTLMAGAACPSMTNPFACAKGNLCVSNQCFKMCNLDGGMPNCGAGACSVTTPALPQNVGICPP
ncbi:MAG: hypothetical protein JNK82_45795 [Myxococcaceae bacterium]|nr:hypothetical protein [Myxococcaceae bacterium]